MTIEATMSDDIVDNGWRIRPPKGSIVASGALKEIFGFSTHQESVWTIVLRH
jgi:hypothetical protein